MAEVKKKEVKTDPKSAKLSFFFSLSDGWQHAARALSITISRKKIEKSQFKSASSSFALTDRLQLLAIAKDAKCKKRVVDVVAFLVQARLLPKVLKMVTFVREQRSIFFSSDGVTSRKFFFKKFSVFQQLKTGSGIWWFGFRMLFG